MQKKKSAVPAYLGVAAVWIGSHFGPGFATGAFSVRWYVKYGWIGLITPLLAMLVTGGVMYYMLEYAREHGTPNYRPFARACYGEKLGGVVAVLYDICFLMTMMCAGGLAFSGEGKLLQGFLGVGYWTTAIITILCARAALPSPARESCCRAFLAWATGRLRSSPFWFPRRSASMARSFWPSPPGI